MSSSESQTGGDPTQVDRSQWRLRRRVFGSLLVAGLVLAPFILVAVWFAATTVEDALLKRQVELESDRLLAAREAGEPAEPSRYFTGFWTLAEVSDPYRSWQGEVLPGLYRPLEALEPGAYEARDSEAFISIAKAGDETLYLFFDVRDLEPLQDLELLFYGSAGLLLMLSVFAVALGLARWLDTEILVPIRRLADAAHWDLETWRESRLESEQRADEIGHLARSTRRAALRLLGFLERERQFTRNASHELRSPLTVIKGATELLRARVQPGSERPLERIERAVRRMESTIETFLFLAREDDEAPRLPTAILPAVDESLEHLPRRPDREHRLRVDIDPSLTWPISPEALRILLDNLIGNALRHGASGDVTITADAGGLRVENALVEPLAEPQSDPSTLKRPFVGEGSGLGLAIVDDLCRRHGWRLELETAAEAGGDRGKSRLRATIRLG